MASKRYYWLRLKDDFFKAKEMKKLRKVAGGDTFTIIYLKLMLLSLQDEGKLFFDGIEDSFTEELALEIDEDVEDVKITIGYLLRTGLMVEISGTEAALTQVPELIGSESDSASRVRNHRARKRLEEEQQALHCNGEALLCNSAVTKSNTEKEIDIDIEKEKDNISSDSGLRKRDLEQEFEELWDIYPRKEGKKKALAAYVRARKRKKGAPTFEEVKAGIEAYNAYLRRTRKSRQYTKTGGVYFQNEAWTDDYTGGDNSVRYDEYVPGRYEGSDTNERDIVF